MYTVCLRVVVAYALYHMAPTKTIMNISMNIMQNHELAMHILIVPKIRNAFMVLIKCVALLMRFPVALVHFFLVKIQRVEHPVGRH